MGISIAVENIKCGGCANSISRALESIEGLRKVAVDVASGTVHCACVPELESVARATAKARSFVSCAIGRVK